MKIDNNIPEEIFELFEKYSFESLSKDQQNKVLQTFSKEEYNLLFYTNSNVKSALSTSSSKEKLLREFDLKHGTKKSTFFLQRNVWKYAASFILGGLLVMPFFLLKKHPEALLSVSNLKDTVYLVKDRVRDTLRIYDTVMLSGYEEAKFKTSIAPSLKETNTQAVQNGTYVKSNELPGLHIMSIDELEGNKNKQKKNSIKDDTLMKQIGFVTSL